MENIKFENKDICKKCGGKCCKKCGCDYSTDNFQDLSMKALEEILSEGKISIVAALNIKRSKNGNKFIIPFLYLRARNKNRNVVDLLSLKSECSMLTKDGCSYSIEERPKGGVNLIPYESKCLPYEEPLKIVEGFERYQNTLSKMVKRITGKTVDQKLREDIENLFYDVTMGNFEYVSDRARKEIAPLLYDLAEIYPEICQKGIDRAKKSQIILRRK